MLGHSFPTRRSSDLRELRLDRRPQAGLVAFVAEGEGHEVEPALFQAGEQKGRGSGVGRQLRRVRACFQLQRRIGRLAERQVERQPLGGQLLVEGKACILRGAPGFGYGRKVGNGLVPEGVGPPGQGERVGQFLLGRAVRVPVRIDKRLKQPARA